MVTHHLAFVEFADAAGIAYIVAAMFVVLILAALWLLVTFAGGLFRRIPLVGGAIAGAFDAAARWIRGAMMATLHGTLWAAERLFRANVIFFENLFTMIRNVSDALGGALEHVANVVIPREIHTLRARIDQVKRNLIFEITALNRSLRQRIDQVGYELRHEISHLNKSLRARIDQVDRELRHALTALNAALRARIDQVDRELRGALADAVAALTARISAVRAELLSDIASAITTLKALIQARFTQAEQYAAQQATGAYNDAIATVDTEAATAAKDTWPEITAMIGTLEKVAGNDFQDTVRLLRQIPASAPADLTAALAAAIRLTPPVMQLAADCVMPDCRDLGPTRQWLHDMQLPLTSAALIAWFIQMVTEPAAWADETYTVLGPLIDAEYAVVTGLLGV